MAGRATHTLILLGAHRTDRVDLGSGPAFAVLGQNHQVSHGGDDPVTQFEAALATAKVGKTVWLLWEGASAQMLDMPTAVVEGLEPEQLADSLSFEAEPLTGLPASDSAIGGIPQRNAAGALPEFKRFWVTQTSGSLRGKFEEAVKRRAAKFGGILHPGGLPREQWQAPAAGGPSHDWRRIEIWDQVSFSLRGRPDGTVETKVIRSSPGSDEWSAELAAPGPLSWMGPGPASRVAPSGRRVTGLDSGERQPVNVDLPPENAPVDWLRAWAAELTAKPRRVPVIESGARVSPYRKYFISGGLAAALAVAVCAGHGQLLSSRTSDMKARADRIFKVQMAMAAGDVATKAQETAINAETLKLKEHLKELDQKDADRATECAKVEKIGVEIIARETRLGTLRSIHRPALGELLAAVADSERSEKSSEIFIKEIRQEKGGELRLSGLCRHSSSADAFATRFEARLNEAGWKVGAAQKTLRDDGLAFDFSVMLSPKVLFGAATTSSPAKTSRGAEAVTAGLRRPDAAALGGRRS